MSKLSRLGHISLYAHDVRRLASFYETALELAVVNHSDETACLAIDPQSGRHDLLILNNPHHMHLAFWVDTLDHFKEVWRRLTDHGILAHGPYVESEYARFSFLDPEGNHVEIIWAHRGEAPPPHRRKISFRELEEFGVSQE
ncbi:ring-cleaving dioxygenase [Brevibacillus sp. HB1.3]|uniref:VOC family protein n=1 Tax=Brevibacillus sp. HB1.3 TaxID=2738842 RepID=UPI0015548B02|nr:VOC family protein [Brevibacillus sp. HB1.3]NQF13040.1 ring-cleaving dioxygenase [Brevibacillus sp. HB1.3]